MAAILFAGTGCSVGHFATARIADALAGSSSVYATDDDIELVGAAVPFALKTMESLLEQQPTHRGLLLATARGFTQFAFGYVALPADELEGRDVAAAYQQRQRAVRLYQRARDFGLRGLEVDHPGFTSQLSRDPTAAVATLAKDDVALMFWTSAAWAAAVSLGKDDAFLVADLPKVTALVERALVLDGDFDHGALHSFLIGYAAAQPGVWSARARDAREHFRRAVELTSGMKAAPYVSLAEVVALNEQNRQEYESLLAQALAIDPAAHPAWKLENLIMQKKARWMLAHVDDQFNEPLAQNAMEKSP